MAAPIVFFDIAGPQDSNLAEFYSKLFGWEIDTDGAVTVPVISPSERSEIMGNMRTDPAEKVLYIGVEDITATLQQMGALGGGVDQPRFEVPGVVILGLARDPAGNRIGLVELNDGNIKVP